jgi:transglutaminase-like putative cysteine protease
VVDRLPIRGHAIAIDAALRRNSVQIRIGYELIFQCVQATPMILNLNVHHSRSSDLQQPDLMRTEPTVPIRMYRDGFGNWCTRILAPAGRIRITADAVINDTGVPEPTAPYARQHAVESLPEETLEFLLGSRYCDTDLLHDFAWQQFGHLPFGWARVQGVCDFVHQHIEFGYAYARATRSAAQAFNERQGVCRDFAHLAIALCRCLNIPARYCTGYLGDIGVPRDPSPMDFAGWMEAYLSDGWHVFDPRHNQRRIGRVLLARGRDAVDVPISMAFGANVLESFKVWSDEIPPYALGTIAAL